MTDQYDGQDDAFPAGTMEDVHRGMDLRTYIATQMMPTALRDVHMNKGSTVAKAAELAVEYADALVDALNQRAVPDDETPRRIRLACTDCYRDDFDGVEEMPDDWEDVREHQSYEDSVAPMEVTGDSSWYTHLGLCPECQASDEASR